MPFLKTFLKRRRSNVAHLRLQLVFSCLVQFFVLCVGLTTPANAQTKLELKGDELAPITQFINGQTLFVAKIDLTNIDVDRLGETLEEVFKQAIIKLGFPSEAIESSSSEFHKTAEALKSDFSEALQDFQKKLGATQLYYVIQSVKGEGSCFIIPVQSMTDEQINSIKGYAKELDLNCALYKKSFIIASSLPLKDIGAYYKNFQSAPNPKIEKFFKDNPQKIAAFYSGRIRLRPLINSFLDSEFSPDVSEDNAQNSDAKVLSETTSKNDQKGSSSVKQNERADLSNLEKDSSRNTGREHIAQNERRATFFQGGVFGKTSLKKKTKNPFEHAPRCVKNAVELFDSSFVEAYGYIDASTLVASASLKFSTPANAGEFKQEWTNINNEIIPVYFDLLQLSVDSVTANSDAPQNDQTLTNLPYLGTVSYDSISAYRLIPLLREIVCGEARTHLPKQNGSQLSFNYSLVDEVNRIGPNAIAFMYFFRSTFSETKEEEIYGKELEKEKNFLDPYIRQTEELNLEQLDELKTKSNSDNPHETTSSSDSNDSNSGDDNPEDADTSKTTDNDSPGEAQEDK